MITKHTAIYKLYPNVTSIIEEYEGGFKPTDKDGKAVDPVKVQQQADILVRSMQQTPVPQPSKANPSLEEFIKAAQEANPDYTTEEITVEYNKRYGN